MTQNDTNKLIENQISSNLRITSVEDNNNIHNFNDVNSNLNIFTESEKLETQSQNINRDLVKLRKDYENNPIVGYLNINHLFSKIDHLRKICSKSPIDILCIDEIKLDSSYTQMLNLKSQVINTCHIVKIETKMEATK